MDSDLVRRLRIRGEQYMKCQLYDQASLLAEAADALEDIGFAMDDPPAVYRHTLHMELGQTYSEYSESADPAAVHGVRGSNYDESYHVTVEPLFARPSKG